MHDLHKLLAKQKFESMEDVEAFMKEVSKGPIPQFEPEGDKERAEQMAYEAMQLDDDDARDMLDEALILDPDCIMAFAGLGALEPNPAIALALYERGIAIGSDTYFADDYLKEHTGHFWLIHETRPFMECLKGIAESNFYLGRPVQAMTTWMHMLELNPNDNQGIRFDLMAVLAGFADQEEFPKLDQQFKDDAAAATRFNRALHAFTTKGAGPHAQKLLNEAIKTNKHVVPLLLQRDPELHKPGGYMLGSKEEALSYLATAHMIWWGAPGGIDWLKKSAPVKGRK